MKTVTKIEANQRTTGSDKKLRVAAYCRVSTGSDDQLESLAEQKKHYETYIQAHENWKFVGLYYDEGISGTKRKSAPNLCDCFTIAKQVKSTLSSQSPSADLQGIPLTALKWCEGCLQ